VVIGGLAVIAHGRNRSTKDADIWLEPFTSAEEWSENVILFCEQFQDLTLHGLPGWKLLNRQSIAEFVEQTGMIRINGLNYPLDIFRRPNEFEADDFDAVCKRATRTEDGTYLPDPLDLVVTKLNTGRQQDEEDSQFLESLVRKHYAEVLPTASIGEVKALFARYLDWQVCEHALKNPSQEVKDYTLQSLQEMADEGDPFSQAILKNRPIPYSHFPQAP
jgi:hypothetical protein